ncbi:MAG: adenylate/guanylate cyclase domain-containing protein [Chloroflexota bacterium]|nr:MAG: adenylate/guanylate cyclase domain-containing protein [Chloroflexota bacterium]
MAGRSSPLRPSRRGGRRPGRPGGRSSRPSGSAAPGARPRAAPADPRQGVRRGGSAAALPARPSSRGRRPCSSPWRARTTPVGRIVAEESAARLRSMQVVVCPSCGEENPAKFRLCGYCGTSLVAELPAQELRKVVTIVFSDLKGSTSLGESLDPEAVREVEARYFEAMRAPLLAHGGTLEKYIGDAIMAVFGFPRVREDDALRAVRAAHGMQRALAALNVELEREYGVTLANRTGVNTGPVVANSDPNANQQIVTGDTVNVAARLEQSAPAQEVLIGELTYQLVRDEVVVESVEPLELKGKAERVPAYRLVDVRAPASGALEEGGGRGAPTPFVGRTGELARLGEALEEAEEFSACRIRLLVGDAGVGKSRVVREFRLRVGDRARILRGRCLPYGDGITFWPLVEIVREAASIDPEDSPAQAIDKIAALMGTEGPEDGEGPGIVERVAAAVGLAAGQFPVAELFWGARKFLEGLARTKPLVLAIDDIHSAEPTFLELLDHLVESVRGAPILVVASARLELQESHPEWWDAQAANRIQLRPLGEEDSGRVMQALLSGGEVEAAVRARIVAAAEGNPLFIEQVVSMLVDAGTLRRDGERWVSSEDAAELAVPPSINALLAARLDHLAREERAVIEPASVIGLVFATAAVTELAPDVLRSAVGGHLMTLARKRFVRPDATDDEGAYRFSNLLIRDTAYGALLKRARATLHERFVAWAERVNKERGREQEFEEILGYHLEQAYRYRTDLGRVDEEGREIGRRGAAKLSAAGRRAFARGDTPAACTLLRRAVALLDETDPLRVELLPELAEALTENGSFDEAKAVIEQSRALAESLADARAAARTTLARVALDLYTAESADAEGALATVQGALDLLTELADSANMARAWRLLMFIHGTSGRYDLAAEAAAKVADHAHAAGDQRLVGLGAMGYAATALHGPTAVADAIRRCEELSEEVRGDRKAEAIISGVLSVLHAMEGDFDRARGLYGRGREMLLDLGPSVTAASTSVDWSRVELLADDLAAAEAGLRADFAALDALGERYFRSTVAALLGAILYERDQLEEADRYTGLAAELADVDDAYSQAAWRATRAKLQARAGESETAIATATEAVRIAGATLDIDQQADTLADLAIVLRLVGDLESSGPPLREALELYERKGDRVSAERVRSLLEGVPAS